MEKAAMEKAYVMDRVAPGYKRVSEHEMNSDQNSYQIQNSSMQE